MACLIHFVISLNKLVCGTIVSGMLIVQPIMTALLSKPRQELTWIAMRTEEMRILLINAEIVDILREKVIRSLVDFVMSSRMRHPVTSAIDEIGEVNGFGSTECACWQLQRRQAKPANLAAAAG